MLTGETQVTTDKNSAKEYIMNADYALSKGTNRSKRSWKKRR